MTTPTVLIVEDEDSFVEALTVGLNRGRFRVIVAEDGATALQKFEQMKPDVILLDLMLPRVSGIDVCREIRKTSTVPIIMVTAKSAEIDMVVGLEVGADDYITKPYRIREVVARLRALLRRASMDASGAPPNGARPADSSSTRSLVVGDVALDSDEHLVTVSGRPVSMPLKEFELLHLLLSNVGRVLPRELLIDRVWGVDYVGDTKTLDVHIKRIRAKIEPDSTRPERIVTIRGLRLQVRTTGP